MLSITELRNGTTIELEGAPHVVISYSHSKMGRGGAVVRTKLKNLKTGASYERSFHGSDKVEEAKLEERGATYLYQTGDNYTFMDDGNYEQFDMTAEQLAENTKYLIEGANVKLMFYDGAAISINMPIKMEFKVKHTEPGVRGDTAQGGTKPATLETGAIVTVPLFINIGDTIRVDTRECTYIERAK